MPKIFIIAGVLTVLVALLVVFGVLGPENKSASKTLLEGKIDGFSVQKPNLVVTGKGLSKIEIWYIPTGTEIGPEDYVLLGAAKLESEEDGKQKWALTIPKEEFLATEIFANGFDGEGKAAGRASLPLTGATEIANALWD